MVDGVTDLWILEKIFLIIAALIMLSLTRKMVMNSVIGAYLYIKADLMAGKIGGAGKMPTIKDAAGMFFYSMAGKVGPAAGDLILEKMKGAGNGPN